MPVGAFSTRVASVTPCSDTPELANANSGRMREGDHRVQLALELAQRRLLERHAQRDEHRERHAGERRVHAGLEHRGPHHEADETDRAGSRSDAAPVEQRERRERDGGDAERDRARSGPYRRTR